MAIAVTCRSAGDVITCRERGTVAAGEPCERTEQGEQVVRELGVAGGHVVVPMLERDAAQPQQVLERGEDLGRAYGALAMSLEDTRRLDEPVAPSAFSLSGVMGL